MTVFDHNIFVADPMDPLWFLLPDGKWYHAYASASDDEEKIGMVTLRQAFSFMPENPDIPDYATIWIPIASIQAICFDMPPRCGIQMPENVVRVHEGLPKNE